MRLENAKAKIAKVMKWMPTSPTALFTAICTSGMPLSAMAASGSCTQNTMTIIAEQVQMSSVSMYTDRLCTRPCFTGCDTLAVAAAFGAEPMPASLENRPRLMPSITTEPAKPPAMDWKLKADSKMVANTAGSSPMLVIVVHSAIRM